MRTFNGARGVGHSNLTNVNPALALQCDLWRVNLQWCPLIGRDAKRNVRHQPAENEAPAGSHIVENDARVVFLSHRPQVFYPGSEIIFVVGRLQDIPQVLLEQTAVRRNLDHSAQTRTGAVDRHVCRLMEREIHIPRQRQDALILGPHVQLQIMLQALVVSIVNADQRFKGKYPHPLVNVHHFLRLDIEWAADRRSRLPHGESHRNDLREVIFGTLIADQKVPAIGVGILAHVGHIHTQHRKDARPIRARRQFQTLRDPRHLSASNSRSART